MTYIMSIIESAKAELARVNFGEEDSKVMISIMESFFAQWDSGCAVSATIPVLDKLLRGLPLSGLTGEEDEWCDVSEYSGGPMWQNKRMTTVFKADGGKAYDIDNPEWDGSFPY